MPPRLAAWLLRLRLRPDDREFVLGDLEEEFLDRRRRNGDRRARRWYWSQALRSIFVRRTRTYQQSRVEVTAKRIPLMSHAFHDIRFAVRLLRRSPAFTAVVVLSLALGIGASTSIFSVVHAALLRPLPFKEPQHLVVPMHGTSQADSWPMSYQQLLQWRDSINPFQQLAGYFSWASTLGGDEAESVSGIRSTANLFPLLGVEPIVGRLFTVAEEARTAEPVVLISESLWRRRFNADPTIQGRRISLSDQMFTVVGVLPASFQRLRPTDRPSDVFAPLRLNGQNAPPTLNFISAVARLKPGQSAAVAQQQLQAAVLRANPDTQPRPRVVVLPLRDRLVTNSRAVLLSLLGAVGFLLLITCANLGNLLLARSVERRRELAVRLAVGASRGRLISQLLTECVLLSGAGGVLGVALAWGTVRALAGSRSLAEAGIYDLSLNWTVLGFSLVLAFAVGVLFGLVPAFRASRSSVTDLRDGMRVTDRDRIRSAFVVAEVALTLLLLTGAGLLGRSLTKLITVDKGFSGDSVLTFGLSTTRARHPRPADNIRFFDEAIARIARVHGVESVGFSTELPLSGGDTNGAVTFEGRTFAPDATPMAQKRVVSAGYFAALGILVRRGRAFRDADDASALPVTIVSEAFVKRWFPNEEPIGKRVGFNWDMDGFQTIVGVVADVKHNGLDDPDTPAIYVHYRQRADSSFTFAVKSSDPPESLVPAIRTEIKAVDPTRPLTDVRTMAAMMAETVSTRRLTLNLISGFALIGLLLAATGIYGIVSHATQQRTREFGIRLALGAEHTSVLGLVLRQGLLLAGIGTALGLVGSLALAGVIRTQLFGIEPTDPATLGTVCGVLIVIGLVACYLPARRAVRINPATILREG